VDERDPYSTSILINCGIRVQPNQVWAAAITDIPMKRGFVYWFAVMVWASRRVLSWRLSNTLTTDFRLETVQEAINGYGKPDISNTDQGGQFTSRACTELLKDRRIQISMDCHGCWRDNVFVERLWKSVKYEAVYWQAYDSVSAAKSGLEHYFRFSNQQRPHSALDDNTPVELYGDKRPGLPLPRRIDARNRKAPLKNGGILSKQPNRPLTPKE
jgi:putative transposase